MQDIRNIAIIAHVLPSGRSLRNGFRFDVQPERNGRPTGLPRNLWFRQKQLDEHRLEATD